MTKWLVDEPSFNEAYGMCWITAVGVRAQAYLKEASEFASVVGSDKDCCRKRAVVTESEESGDLHFVFVGRSVGPEQLAHLCDLIGIMEVCWPDGWIRHRVDYLVKRLRSMESDIIL